MNPDIENTLAIINNSPDIFSNTPFGYIPACALSGGQILCIIMRTLRKINPAFGDLSCRTAFIASSIVSRGVDDNRLSLKNIIMISLLQAIITFSVKIKLRTKVSHQKKSTAIIFMPIITLKR